MSLNHLVIPHYCPQCQNLSFIYRNDADTSPTFLDYDNSMWRYHACSYRHYQSLIKESQAKKLLDLEFGVQMIPFNHRESKSKKTQSLPSMGVIISIPQKEEEPRFIKVITIDNSIISLRILDFPPDLSVGLPIDLTECVRVGQGKYRLKKVSYLLPVSGEIEKKEDILEYYQLSIVANDPEQLETFVNKLLNTFLTFRFSPLSVLPFEVSQVENSNRYHRVINIPPVLGLKGILENIQIPEFIEIKLNQMNQIPV